MGVCAKAKGEICGGQCDMDGYCASNTKCNETVTESDFGWSNKLGGFCVENTPRDCPQIQENIGILHGRIKQIKQNIARGTRVKFMKIRMLGNLKKIRNLKKSNKHICQFV